MNDEAETEEVTLSLRDDILDALLTLRPKAGDGVEAIDQATRDQADAVMALLNNRGHYLPGLPPAAQILKDAQQFAGQFMLAMLTIRITAMLDTGIETPETAGAKRWIRDYIDGKNHGPVGKPMLWPAQLPGMVSMLMKWGYQHTPTVPPYVARAQAPGVLATSVVLPPPPADATIN